MASHQTRVRFGRILSLSLLLSLAGGAACSKKKNDEPAEPKAAEPAMPESSVDPRLASSDDAGAMTNPHGGAMANPHGGVMANPHGEAGAANPHGGLSPHERGMPAAGGGGGGSTVEKTADGRAVFGPVTAAVPKDWKESPTSSSMRVAQWTLPGKAGDGELVVYYFGTGGAGGAEANLTRWIGQFEQKDGSPSDKKAKIDKKTVAGMAVTQVEVTGRYVAAVMPGSPEKNDKPDYMMLGAIVETSAGPYYFKAVGPEATLKAARKSFDGFVASLKPGDK